jgi:hypothetical protein
MTDWEISPLEGNYFLFDLIRQKAHPNPSALIDAPGLLFSATDFETLRAAVRLVLYLDWDCIILDSEGTVLIHISHDDFVDFFTKP